MNFIESDELHQMVVNAFSKNGLSDEHAQIVATTLVDANLRGVDTHGVVLVETYVNRLISGSLNPTPSMKIEVRNKSSIHVDADNGLGQVAGNLAMDHVMDMAKQMGISMGTVHNSNHFGAAAYYSMMAVRENCIGIAMSNASPRLAPWGGLTPTYGNNPWSVAVPYSEYPIVLDIANSVVAFSKILTARKSGDTIPTDWALTRDGNRTDNPNEAELLLPFGGHKGYGIAFMVEILSGVLSGAALGKEVGRYNSLEHGQNVGHSFIAIHIPSLLEEANFQQRLNDFIDQLRASELVDGNQQVYLPGEIEAIRKEKRLKEGIPLENEIYDYLLQFK